MYFTKKKSNKTATKHLLHDVVGRRVSDPSHLVLALVARWRDVRRGSWHDNADGRGGWHDRDGGGRPVEAGRSVERRSVETGIWHCWRLTGRGAFPTLNVYFRPRGWTLLPSAHVGVDVLIADAVVDNLGHAHRARAADHQPLLQASVLRYIYFGYKFAHKFKIWW